MNILNLPKRLGQLLIVAYQHTLSLDHGPLARFYPYPVCRFHPTCSEYGYQAVGKYGIIRGSWLTLKRILRCNPWSVGGEDPLK
ncbi:MAG: membrane protein insertion efficiency factor YidD [Alphaproteobacteria bacterium]|nr:membrane protein insertion efficiency factor YidD [Alphaproteobacteria bacterium]